jgi:hypothetical protein
MTRNNDIDPLSANLNPETGAVLNVVNDFVNA